MTTINPNSAHRILVTGATGYVGGRLVPRLLEAGHRVRVAVRDPGRLQGRPWVKEVEVVRADVLQPDTLAATMHEIDAAYYLIHSMYDSDKYRERDLTAARNFGQAARRAGVGRIIYLGGLGDQEAKLSEHLRSRQETGQALAESGVPVTEFRAAIIVGSGSVSFEMIRYLTERIPVMICPRWVHSRVQPIAVRNVLDYLVACLDVPESQGQVLEIGGSDVLTYGQMMLGYAKARDLKRLLVSVPVLTPRLSSYWVHWVTPVPSEIALPLIEGLHNDTVVRSNGAAALFPSIKPMDYATAVHRALLRLEIGEVETSWSDALFSSQKDKRPVVLTTEQGMIIERRQVDVQAPARSVFQTCSGLGGERGWPYYNWAWRFRGVLDRLVGGVGFRRGRRHPDNVRVGDAIDFWRVEAVSPPRCLRLRAEMKVPGRAWLQFEVVPKGQGTSRLTQTAYFAPKGLAGFVYWYALYPIHSLIFSGMIRQLGQRAETQSRATKRSPG